MKAEPTYHQDTFYSSNNKFCPSRRGSFNARYRNNRFFDRTKHVRKVRKHSDRSSDSQGFRRKTNPLDKNGEMSKCNVRGSTDYWMK